MPDKYNCINSTCMQTSPEVNESINLVLLVHTLNTCNLLKLIISNENGHCFCNVFEKQNIWVGLYLVFFLAPPCYIILILHECRALTRGTRCNTVLDGHSYSCTLGRCVLDLQSSNKSFNFSVIEFPAWKRRRALIIIIPYHLNLHHFNKIMTSF